jgi:hypothetical protein
MSSMKSIPVLVVLLLLGGAPAAAQKVSGPAPVIVENDQSKPVPTTAEIVNAPDDPVLVRDVDRRRRQVFTQRLEMDVTVGNSIQKPFLTVPAGRRAVIETVSCRARTTAGVGAMAVILLSGHDVILPLARAIADPILFNQDHHGIVQPMTLYLDHGAFSSSQTYFIRLQLSAPAITDGSCSVSGYLTDRTSDPPPLPQ